MKDTTMKDTTMEDTVMDNVTMETISPRKKRKGKYTRSEKAHFLNLCRTHGMAYHRDADRQPSGYPYVLASMQHEAARHIEGGDLHASDPWQAKEYNLELETAREWLQRADLGETEMENSVRKCKALDKHIREVRAAHEILRSKFERAKRLGLKCPDMNPVTFELLYT